MVRDTTVTVDTVFVEQEPIIVKEPAIVRDTVYIDTSGQRIETEVASLDTVFAVGSKLSIKYYVAPRNFEVQYDPAPIQRETVEKIVTETVTVKPRKWPLIALAVGCYILGSL